MRQLTILMVLLASVGSFAATITVNADGTGDYATIQAAIDAADPNENDVVMLTPGIYTGDGNRDIDFLGKAITVQSTDPTDPNIVANTVIDCQGSETNPHRAFLFITAEGQNSILDGLTIRNGYAAAPGNGGALFINASNPVIQNCAFMNNYGSNMGGAVFADSSDVITLTHCIFDDNQVAVWIRSEEVLVSGCIFVANQIGLSISTAALAEVSKCLFMDNQQGMTAYSPTLNDYVYINESTFLNNGAEGLQCSGIIQVQSSLFSRNGGSGVAVGGQLTARNCTFNSNNISNQTYLGGAISNWCPFDSTNNIENCIFWDNNPQVVGIGCTAKVPPSVVTFASFSILQPGWDTAWPTIQGTNIVTDDPQFIDPNNNDCHIPPTSPAVDAGDPNYIPPPELTDIDGQPRLMGTYVDMGADEWFAEGLFINLSPNTMNFSALLDGPNPAEQILQIANAGGGSLNWQIDETCSWVSVSQASGSCGPGVSQDVTISVGTSALGAGAHSCVLTVTDPLAENNPQTVTVTLTLQGPILSVSNTIFNFAADLGGPDPNNQILTLSNPGGGTLNWSADTTGMPSWLAITPTGGSLDNGQNEQVTLSVTVAGLTENIYSYAFELTAPDASGSPKNIQVNLNYGNNCYGGPDYSEWITVGTPESWCWPMQCHGDADGSMEAIGKCLTRIGFNDITIMLAGFNKPYSGDPAIDPWIAADFDHYAEQIGKGFYRVGFNDINVLLSWFNTPGIPEDCQTASPVSP